MEHKSPCPKMLRAYNIRGTLYTFGGTVFMLPLKKFYRRHLKKRSVVAIRDFIVAPNGDRYKIIRGRYKITFHGLTRVVRVTEDSLLTTEQQVLPKKLWRTLSNFYITIPINFAIETNYLERCRKKKLMK
ncbi:plasma membrane intrinsic protein 1 [Striga asiatica]|uniref:Plasma membrane intrinsic protein 1 n=1 Tax=Striga asiatica TaxID=4170 RepID=A0A5A7PMH5_STRAF|nr:plasma membrane intrinsic protein 1 [Striga asiatica]